MTLQEFCDKYKIVVADADIPNFEAIKCKYGVSIVMEKGRTILKDAVFGILRAFLNQSRLMKEDFEKIDFKTALKE
jgi:hypothetical protein